MIKIKARGQKWLKAFHILFAALWVGGAASVTLMLYFLKAESDMQLYGINQSINFIDIWIIIPENIGIMLTGIMYSSFTKWGWFRHRWVTVKWIIALYGMIFGIIWLGPWASNLEHISKAEGLEALGDEKYKSTLKNLYGWGGFQTLTLIFAGFISTLKPWRKK